MIRGLKINSEILSGLSGERERFAVMKRGDEDYGPMQLLSLRAEARLEQDRMSNTISNLESTMALVRLFEPLVSTLIENLDAYAR